MTDFNCMLAKLQKSCLNSFQGQFEKQTYVRVALTLKIEKALAKSLIRQLTLLGLLEPTADEMVYQPTAAGRLIQTKPQPYEGDMPLKDQVAQAILSHHRRAASTRFVVGKLGLVGEKDRVRELMLHMAKDGQLVRYPNGEYRVCKQWRYELLGQAAGGVQ